VASYTFYATTADGYILSANASWATVQAGSVSLSAVTTGNTLYVGKLNLSGSNQFNVSALGFDTSSLPDDAVITATSLSVCPSANATYSWVLEARTYNWGATLTTADYRTPTQWSALTLLAQYDLSGGLTADTHQALTSFGTNLDDAINKSGATYLMLGDSTFGGIAPPTNTTLRISLYSADETGTTKDPKLEVTTFEPPSFRPYAVWIA